MESFFTIKIDGKNIEKDFPIFYIETFVGVNRVPYCIIKVQDFDNKLNINLKIKSRLKGLNSHN